jgi:hypothetical protein
METAGPLPLRFVRLLEAYRQELLKALATNSPELRTASETASRLGAPGSGPRWTAPGGLDSLVGGAASAISSQNVI